MWTEAEAVNVTYTRQYGQISSRSTQRGSGPTITASWSYDPRGLITSLSNGISVASVPSCVASRILIGVCAELGGSRF